MHENQGNSVIFFAHYTEAGVSKTGLTVTINIYEVARDGTAAQVATDQACTEIGAGLYRYLLAGATVDAAAEYVGVFHTATATVDCQDIPAIWVIDRAGLEKLDSGGVPVASIATDALTAAAVKADAVTKIQNGLAIEATLTAMKGAGWSTETLAAIDIILDAIKAKTDLLTTGTAVSITSAVEGSEITGYIGATIEFALTGLGNISTYTKLYVTVKRDLADADSASIIQLEKTAGLVYINGAAATTAANGTLTVDDAVAGNITGVLKPAESVKLSSGRYQYDVKGITTAGRAVIISTSEFTLADAVTKAIT